MPTTQQEKEARWPWKLSKTVPCGQWMVDRDGVNGSNTILTIDPSPAAAIYAIAKTQE